MWFHAGEKLVPSAQCEPDGHFGRRVTTENAQGSAAEWEVKEHLGRSDATSQDS
jgi:hypothetical protein